MDGRRQERRQIDGGDHAVLDGEEAGKEVGTPILGQARSVFFEGMTPPASTLVGVSALAAPKWLIEIEAVAVVD